MLLRYLQMALKQLPPDTFPDHSKLEQATDLDLWITFIREYLSEGPQEIKTLLDEYATIIKRPSDGKPGQKKEVKLYQPFCDLVHAIQQLIKGRDARRDILPPSKHPNIIISRTDPDPLYWNTGPSSFKPDVVMYDKDRHTLGKCLFWTQNNAGWEFKFAHAPSFRKDGLSRGTPRAISSAPLPSLAEALRRPATRSMSTLGSASTPPLTSSAPAASTRLLPAQSVAQDAAPSIGDAARPAKRRKFASDFQSKGRDTQTIDNSLDHPLRPSNSDYSFHESPEEQICRFAFETLNAGGDGGGIRSHVPYFQVTGSRIKMWRFDRSGICCTETEIDFRQDIDRLALLVWAMKYWSWADWGFLPGLLKAGYIENANYGERELDDHIIERKPNFRSLVGATFSSPMGLVKLGEPIVKGTVCITGRATSIHEAHKLTIDGHERQSGNYIVKTSFPWKSRHSEATIIATIQSRLSIDSDARRKYANHLPKLHLAIDQNVQDDFWSHMQDGAKDRIFRVLVFDRLDPITSIVDFNEFMGAFVGAADGTCSREICDSCSLCVAGHNWLWVEMGIEQRDVSLGNIMVRRREGRVFGVINDFDLALDRNRTTSTHSPPDRTGTPVFMAVELQDQSHPSVKHLYRHDLESFFWILYWVTRRYDHDPERNNLRELETEVLEELLSEDSRLVYKQKRLVLTLGETLQTTAWGRSGKKLTKNLILMFHEGIKYKESFNPDTENEDEKPLGVFDPVTLGGAVTYARFRRVCRGGPLVEVDAVSSRVLQ